MATFLQLYGEMLTRELGSADASSLFTTARRKAAINEAQLEFVKQTECFTRQASVTIVDNTQEYDLDAAGIISAEDFLWLAAEPATHKYTDTSGTITYTTGENFPRKDVPVMMDEGIDWRNTSVVSELPSSYYIREDGGSVYLGIVPIPDIGTGDSAVVLLPYVAKPPDMTDDAHEPFSVVMGTSPKKTLRPWHQALVHYAAALLEPLRKNYDGEQRQRQLFAAQVADYLQRQRPQNGQTVRLTRNYYREARGRAFNRPLDPRIY